MTTKRRQYSRAKSKAIFMALAFASLLLVGGVASRTDAQSGLVISNVRETTVTSTYADIAWTTNDDADSQVRWGPQGAGMPNLETSSTQVQSHSLRIEPLTPNTVYEYQVGSKRETDDETERVWAPALPNTFTAPAGGDGGTEPPTLTSIGVMRNCCTARFIFETNRVAGYTLEFVSGAPAAGATSTSALGDYRDSWNVNYPFDAGDPQLTASTEYGYTISIFDDGGNRRIYGPFYFTTGTGPADFTFTPGVCVDGTLYGTCNANGEYCANGLVLNCVLCGYQCQVGQTCRNGGACTDDPGTGESAYQCNPPSCYETVCVGGANNGASCTSGGQCPGGSCTGEDFLEPAGPGCYLSWQKCNANTVLKVQKDRVCNKWMTCRTQTDVQNPTTKQTESLCYDLAACASIGPDGQCARPLFGKYCLDDPLRFCETGADCDIHICKPASGKWCKQAKEEPAGSGIFEYVSCEDADDCTAEGLAPTCEEFFPANVTYTAPDDVQKIRYLTGSINAGLSWSTGPSALVEGSFPWYFMPQVGSVVPIGNGHFEERVSVSTFDQDGTKKTTVSYTTKPWSEFGAKGSDNTDPSVLVTPESIGDQNQPNHVLKIDPTDAPEPFSGAQAPSQSFTISSQASYVVGLRMKSSTPDGQTVKVRFLSDTGEETELLSESLTGGWKTFVSSPKSPDAGGGSARLQIVRTGGSTEPFFVDDIELNVALGVKTDGSNPVFIPRSCRLYPREDSLLCEYKDDSGIRFKGWYGYCLEHDSKFADRCVSWWPIDIIGGESDVFGTFGSEVAAGYHDREPLYYCLEAKGVGGGDTIEWRKKPDDCDVIDSASTEGNIRYGKTPMLGYFTNSNGNDCSFTKPDGIWQYRCFDNALVTACNDDALWGECGDTTFNNTFPVVDDDKYPKSSISRIVLREIQASHSDWSFSPIVLDESNNWKATYTNGNNQFSMEAVFDEQNVLEKYVLYGCDGSKNDGGFAAVVEYHLREVCTKIVKVVDEDGKNKAWSSRVSVGSAYRTLESNYSYTDDLAPFGGAVPESSDPSDWSDLLYVEAPRTNESFTYPYQSRAGLPAACKGDCSTRVCIGGGNKNGLLCRTAEDCRDTEGNQGVCSGVGTCSKSKKGCSANWDSTGRCMDIRGTEDTSGEACCSKTDPKDICIGGALSSLGNQGYNISDHFQCELSGAWCRCGAGDCGNPVLNPNGDNLCKGYNDSDRCLPIVVDSYKGKALYNLSRLFAQSYGFWTWNPKLGNYEEQTIDQALGENGTQNWTPPSQICQSCSLNVNLACSVDDDCKVLGTCDANRVRGQHNIWAETADFCGNRTNAFGFRVNDHPKDEQDITNVDIIDGGWVNFKFNTAADSEQLPLSSILIKWSTSEQQSIYFPYAPKSDKDAPHSISHRYFCSPKIMEDLPTCEAVPKNRSYPCKQGSSCVYQPRVVVQDNWGWCNAVPADFATMPSCAATGSVCGADEICEPRYQVCVDFDQYQSSSRVCNNENAFPPSWADASNGTFDQRRAIEVRVQSSGD
jgi:hypothetical protein